MTHGDLLPGDVYSVGHEPRWQWVLIVSVRAVKLDVPEKVPLLSFTIMQSHPLRLVDDARAFSDEPLNAGTIYRGGKALPR